MKVEKNGDDILEFIDILFEYIIYDKHPEIESYSVYSKELKNGITNHNITLYVDLNMVDMSMTDNIVIEDYYLLDNEYDDITSEYIMEMITDNIKETVRKSLRLINSEKRIGIDTILKF